MIPAAAIHVLRDRRLKRRDLRVYSVALERLSFYEPKPFKARTVAREADMAFQHAAASIRRLVSFGYLESGPSDGRLRTYLIRTTPLV